jgi:hypothetical protein
MPAADIQKQIRAAMEYGLKQKFEEPVGRLLATAMNYMPRVWFEPDEMRKIVERDGAAAVKCILQGQVSGVTMLEVQSAMIGSAILHDRDSVMRWAKEGATRSARVGGDWPSTEPEWKWVLANPDQYILLVCELKAFLNQM